jgi:BirA family biotin operon repressor/biotin-[acetyl-CoA-carboxylase] ligase
MTSSFTPIDAARLRASRLVATVEDHQTLGSTSDRALTLAAQGEVPLPLLVVAAEQTAGRGRGSNRWWSPRGGLTFSLALEAPPTKLPPPRWPQVALATGLAVCEALEELVPRADLRLKWPNDVYLSGRKVCGILSESVPGCRDRIVIGIGINVNNTPRKCYSTEGPGAKRDPAEDGISAACQAAPEAASRIEDFFETNTDKNRPLPAIALVEHDGCVRDLTDVLLAVLDRFEWRWQVLVESGFTSLVAPYRQRCLLTGRTLRVQTGLGEIVVGLCRGIDEEGRLQLVTEQGVRALVSGSVLAWESV